MGLGRQPIDMERDLVQWDCYGNILGLISHRGIPKFRTVRWSSSIFDILNLSCSVTPEYHMVAHYIPINNSNTYQNVLKLKSYLHYVLHLPTIISIVSWLFPTCWQQVGYRNKTHVLWLNMHPNHIPIINQLR